jgi:hypothetical protein
MADRQQQHSSPFAVYLCARSTNQHPSLYQSRAWCGEQLFSGSFGSIAKGWITVIRSSAPREGCTPVPKMESKVAEKVEVVCGTLSGLTSLFIC